MTRCEGVSNGRFVGAPAYQPSLIRTTAIVRVGRAHAICERRNLVGCCRKRSTGNGTLPTGCFWRQRSCSLLEGAAIASFLSPDAVSQRKAPVTKWFDRQDRWLDRLERYLGTSVETPVLFVRFWLTTTPRLLKPRRAAARAWAIWAMTKSSRRSAGGYRAVRSCAARSRRISSRTISAPNRVCSTLTIAPPMMTGSDGQKLH